jgi:hypothetical protein
MRAHRSTSQFSRIFSHLPRLPLFRSNPPATLRFPVEFKETLLRKPEKRKKAEMAHARISLRLTRPSSHRMLLHTASRTSNASARMDTVSPLRRLLWDV